MNRAILLLCVASIAVMLTTNCGGVVTDFEEIYAEANQQEQAQAQLEEQAEKEKQAQLERQVQLEKQIQLEKELIAKRNREEFRLTAHLGEWFFKMDYGATGVLRISGNNRWSMSGGHLSAVSGEWTGDATSINFYDNPYFYPTASGRVVESGVLEYSILNQGTHPGLQIGAIVGTVRLRRN